MNKNRFGSTPNLIIKHTPEADQGQRIFDHSSLPVVASHLKLLLKIIQDHKDAANNKKKDGGNMLRVAGMMTIIENIRSKIQKYPSKTRSNNESPKTTTTTDNLMRRSNSNSNVPKNDEYNNNNYYKRMGAKTTEIIDEEKKYLRKEVNESLSQRRTTQTQVTNLIKEKNIMSKEVSKHVNYLNAMEELISDLEDEINTMTNKVRECVIKHCDEGPKPSDLVILQDKKNIYVEQIQCIREKYQISKKKTKDLRQENTLMLEKMDKIKNEVKTSIAIFKIMKERSISEEEEEKEFTQEYMKGLEQVYEFLENTNLNKI